MELSTVWRVMSLPLLEPLNATRLQKLSTIAMSALLAALTVATASAIIAVASQATSSSKVLFKHIMLWLNLGISIYYEAKLQISKFANIYYMFLQTPPPPREDDLDTAAPAIAEKALDLFNVILNAVRSSTRAGGHVSLKIIYAFTLLFFFD